MASSANEIEILGESEAGPTQTGVSKQIDLIEQNRKNIRTLIRTSLQIASLLLAVALGVLYFSYGDNGKDGNGNDIVPFLTKSLLFIASVLFPISILINIYALRLKPILSIVETTQAIELDKVYRHEKYWTFISTFILGISVCLLVFGMIDFALDRANIIWFDQHAFLLSDYLKYETTFMWSYVSSINWDEKIISTSSILNSTFPI